MALAKFKKACASNVSGIAALFIAEAANVTAFAVTSGEISTLTSTAGFKEITGDNDSVTYIADRAEGLNAVYTHTVGAMLGKPNTAQNTLINALEAAAPCGLMALVLDGNGEVWLLGYSEAEGKTRLFDKLMVKRDAGKYGEQGKNSTEISLKMINGYAAYPLNAALKATVIARTASFCDFN